MQHILFLCGGIWVEHEVSLLSTKNVIQALDKKLFSCDIVYVNKKWQRKHLIEENFHKYCNDVPLLEESTKNSTDFIINLSSWNPFVSTSYDVIFSLIHWTQWEDWVTQWMAKLLNIPIVWCDVLSSAICMDKDVTKRLLRDAGLAIVPFQTYNSTDQIPQFDFLQSQLWSPFFVKPANSGSSVGVSKVNNQVELTRAISEAFLYDKKLLIEQWIQWVEIECAVLWNHDPIVSRPWKIINHKEFYDYSAKYLEENSSSLELPAILSQDIIDKARNYSLLAYKALWCSGMARVDFFLTHEGQLYINEINTIPGFTNISMYPKLMELEWISYKQLITTLIQLALEQ